MDVKMFYFDDVQMSKSVGLLLTWKFSKGPKYVQKKLLSP